jgi:DNA-directed RNA polymerase sigma subunit (sigma70/sigma32)
MLEEKTTPEENYVFLKNQKYRKKHFDNAVKTLSDIERRVLIARRLTSPVKTLKELVPIIGKSKERIRQIEYEAIEKIRTHIESETNTRLPEFVSYAP